MLNKPPLNQLMENMDSKYDLVIVAAKRARTMISDNPDMLATSSMNPVSMALNEIAEGKTFWPPKNTAE
ncbi:MAG: DNA-directed RNA polymerase subunit omega [Firmicutes bacterium]|nr:DNA-directed RNA polymerase subunit omega [Bacillota bacterium]